MHPMTGLRDSRSLNYFRIREESQTIDSVAVIFGRTPKTKRTPCREIWSWFKPTRSDLLATFYLLDFQRGRWCWEPMWIYPYRSGIYRSERSYVDPWSFSFGTSQILFLGLEEHLKIRTVFCFTYLPDTWSHTRSRPHTTSSLIIPVRYRPLATYI